jgi:signal transduction histidine kinase
MANEMVISVLLCDTDDRIAKLQYELMMAGGDFAVDAMNDAFRAVEAAARGRPDVIVTDLGLEGLGGAELVKRFRASSPSSKVIAWASARDAARVAEILSAGAVGYLVKSDSPPKVLAAIRAAVHGEVTLSATVASLVSDELIAFVARTDELEAELEEVRERVEQGTASKNEFLANISHELRTPITVAKSITYILKNPDVPDSERSGFIDRLQASLDRLTRIVDEIITMAELERGSFELNLVDTDLAPLIRHAVDETARQHPAIEIEAQIPETLPWFADGSRISSVVRELVDNACRYSPPDLPVEVRASILDQGLVVQVTDRGEGLHRSVAAQSFQRPFSIGEATLRKEKSGVGVGLHLARQLVVQHGGIMWTDPVPNGGTRVSFCIPSSVGENISAPPVGAA